MLTNYIYRISTIIDASTNINHSVIYVSIAIPKIDEVSRDESSP